MATAKIAYRKGAIGISAGLGIALPLAAYAATLPFDAVSGAVRADVVPFAAGALAGVGMLTLTGHLLDMRAERLAAEEEEAAQFCSIFSDSDAVVARTAREKSSAPQRGKRFAGASAPKGVPVISRATDALDEIDAWAEIDAMFSEDSPISCDPARSKDVYQIAFEELRRAERQATAANTQAAKPGDLAASAPDSSSPIDRAIAAPSEPVRQPVPSEPVEAPQDTAQNSAPTVPMADYSGHEDMWASALSILEEPVEASGEKIVSLADQDREQAVAAPSETSYLPRSRMAAVAEGGNATKIHSRVNSMIEEEFNKSASKSVHHTAHEYLKVIEGGTASMPRLKAVEA